MRHFASTKKERKAAVREAFKDHQKQDKVPLPTAEEIAAAAPPKKEFSMWDLPLFRLAKPYFNQPQFRPRQSGMGHEYAMAALMGVLSAWYIIKGPPTIVKQKTTEEQPIRFEGSESE